MLFRLFNVLRRTFIFLLDLCSTSPLAMITWPTKSDSGDNKRRPADCLWWPRLLPPVDSVTSLFCLKETFLRLFTLTTSNWSPAHAISAPTNKKISFFFIVRKSARPEGLLAKIDPRSIYPPTYVSSSWSSKVFIFDTLNLNHWYSLESTHTHCFANLVRMSTNAVICFLIQFTFSPGIQRKVFFPCVKSLVKFSNKLH